MDFDFAGWATKANLKCSDGRTIMKDAFIKNDGQTVPLVWNHQHDDPNEVLGHALLENREEGVYAYCKFNDTESGKTAKLLVQHGDVDALSIYANQLKQNLQNVIHGNIREVSLVLAGANPGASIDSIIMHGEESNEEAIIFTGENIELSHSDTKSKEDDELKDEPKKEPEKTPAKTVKDVFSTLNQEQQDAVYALIDEALNTDPNEGKEDTKNEEETTMKHNAFDQDDTQSQEVLSHSDMADIIANAKRTGSLKNEFLQRGITNDVIKHSLTDADGNTITYGMANIGYMFPDARNTTTEPTFISRDMAWVSKVMAAKHLPFSRVKSMHANITGDEARARGYIKGKQKVEEVFALLKRVTNPTTVYKKQKLDRDDIVDITDLDVVAWLKAEMRIMLNEEIARAALIGDGRVAGTDDKISEDCIRPIWKDADLYTIKKSVVLAAGATDYDRSHEFIRQAVKSRKEYKGSGNPTLFTTEDVLTDCLLMEDGTGRIIYDSIAKLATALRVSEIVTVPVMENQVRTADGFNYTLMGIIVNVQDYSFGADKGGDVNMFEDFDIDFNQEKYLIETRCSGALTVPYSAIAIELKTTAA